VDSPIVILFISTIILGFIVWFFWPDKGIYALIKKSKRNTKRVLIEDALKHIYDCETKNATCSLNSIAGNLSISGGMAAKLVAKLHAMDLIDHGTDNLVLSSHGRSYALRVIRVHRLVERYLADETGVHEKDWHTIAEEKEHELSDLQVDELAAQLSNPMIDPHGDPIPSSSGEIKNLEGFPLTSLKPGEVGIITHIEDEPDEIYKQLIAENLYRGKQIRMLKANNERIKFIANDEECVLAPVFAANITVTKIEKHEEIRDDFKRLSNLKIGEKGIVIGLSRKCRGQQRRRLMDFGIVPGTEVSVEMESFGRDPVAYLVRGTTVALRKNQSELIYIKDFENEGS
jgi:DtxR family Mn-dependent transcriptional regulator